MANTKGGSIDKVPVKVEGAHLDAVRHYGHLWGVPQHEMIGMSYFSPSRMNQKF